MHSNNSALSSSEELVEVNSATIVCIFTLSVYTPRSKMSQSINNASFRTSLTYFVIRASNVKKYIALFDTSASFPPINHKGVVDFRVQKMDVAANVGRADARVSRHVLNEN